MVKSSNKKYNDMLAERLAAEDALRAQLEGELGKNLAERVAALEAEHKCVCLLCWTGCLQMDAERGGGGLVSGWDDALPALLALRCPCVSFLLFSPILLRAVRGLLLLCRAAIEALRKEHRADQRRWEDAKQRLEDDFAAERASLEAERDGHSSALQEQLGRRDQSLKSAQREADALSSRLESTELSLTSAGPLPACLPWVVVAGGFLGCRVTMERGVRFVRAVSL